MKKISKSKFVFLSVFLVLIIIMPFLFIKIFLAPQEKSATDFYMGGDISSIIETEENGGKFYNEEGIEQDVFKILKEHGMDSVRIRIWNNPVDANGTPYANGHNDLETAIEIGKRATDCGMRVLVDFHYSDYWADPSSQLSPKAWEHFTITEKEDALYQYTKESLKTLLEHDINVTMVQIGNETTSGIAGENRWNNMTTLMSAGSKAVREVSAEYDKDILVAMHFTEPKYYDWYAKQLQTFHVDYDVFASSYYPYWHGSIENLQVSLQNIIDTYHKKVLIVEYAYPHNFSNTDKYDNTISYGSSLEFPYAVNKYGQQEFIEDMKKTAISLGDDCLGLFYWEPAWIGYSDTSDIGSPWENQALFDKDGKPLPALSSFLFSEDH